MAGAIEIKGLEKQYGSFKAVDGIDMSIPAGSFVSLLGPSGCGKTTTLRMLAGFTEPSAGTIAVDGEVVSSPRAVKSPEDRAMGMVFQSYAVWPHMKVFDNVAYGLRHGPNRVSDKSALRAKVEEMIEMVGLAGQEDKLPNALSGGQQQRVALARALITEPKILLLDEPLSNLDAKLRETMRFELRRLQKRVGITTVFVTHSQEEALLLSDLIVVMRGGRIIERNTPELLYQRPETRFVADFVGLANFLEGTVREGGEAPTVTTPIGEIRCNSAWAVQAGEAAQVLIRPEAIALRAQGQGGAPDGHNLVLGTIAETHFNGSIVDYVVAVGESGTTLRVQAFAPRLFSEGDAVSLAFSPDAARLVRGD